MKLAASSSQILLLLSVGLFSVTWEISVFAFVRDHVGVQSRAEPSRL